ncbi:hypothetical protein Enr13x_04090 [Stieleria neptunia]|uniref:Uncharacterized protein n=1 Tax=Stieleria neptunia TaxID=2527979 RepID=A0A518HIH3_9BACT|nr:hypothetical protein Enr13x_04090 [Stieleria neptunia]
MQIGNRLPLSLIVGCPSICILKWSFCNLQSCGCQQSKRKPYFIRARCCQRSTHRLPRAVPRAGGYRRLEIANRRRGGLGIVPAIGNARNGTRASPRNTEHKACPGDNLTPAGKARIHHCSRIEKRRAKRPASPLDHRDGVRSRVCLTGNDREIANCKLNNANWQLPTIESHRGSPVNLQSCGCQQSKRNPYVIRARCCQRSTHRLPRAVPRAGGYRRLEIANRRQGGLGIVPAIGNARNGTRASPRNTEHKACPGDNLTPAGKARIHHCSRIEKRRAKRPAFPLGHRDGVRSRVCLTGNDREIANCKLNNANWQLPTIESHRGSPVNLQSCGCQQSKRKPYLIRARCCQRSTHRLPRPVPRISRPLYDVLSGSSLGVQRTTARKGHRTCEK